MSNALHKFAITFKPTPRANAITWHRFYPNAQKANEDARAVVLDAYPKASGIVVSLHSYAWREPTDEELARQRS